MPASGSVAPPCSGGSDPQVPGPCDRGCRVCQAQTEVVRPQLLDRRKLAEHVEGSADAATGAADQVAVQTDQLAIAAAQSGSLDVPA